MQSGSEGLRLCERPSTDSEKDPDVGARHRLRRHHTQQLPDGKRHSSCIDFLHAVHIMTMSLISVRVGSMLLQLSTSWLWWSARSMHRWGRNGGYNGFAVCVQHSMPTHVVGSALAKMGHHMHCIHARAGLGWYLITCSLCCCHPVCRWGLQHWSYNPAHLLQDWPWASIASGASPHRRQSHV